MLLRSMPTPSRHRGTCFHASSRHTGNQRRGGHPVTYGCCDIKIARVFGASVSSRRQVATGVLWRRRRSITWRDINSGVYWAAKPLYGGDRDVLSHRAVIWRAVMALRIPRKQTSECLHGGVTARVRCLLSARHRTLAAFRRKRTLKAARLAVARIARSQNAARLTRAARAAGGARLRALMNVRRHFTYGVTGSR